MNTDIKRILVDTFGRISYLFVIFFFFIYTLYLHNEVPEALKEAWSASLSFLSVLATLGAAYIASQLFNDWREQPKLNILHEMLDLTREIQVKFYDLRSLNPYSNESQNDSDFYEVRNKIVKDINNMIYLDKKYRSLLRGKDKIETIFSVYATTNKTNIIYLQFILSKSGHHYFFLKRVKEKNENERTEGFHEAMRFFTNAYFLGMQLRDESGHYVFIEDLGKELDTVISKIYEDIENRII